jgi:nitroimidazol reductase NimA-like FMN-containing flavoprotein (pyridoxamine 5'-phosphate oxidase superfamily)
MPKEYLNQPYNEMRRKDRGKDEAWIKTFLQRAPVGVMATSYEGQPFINTRQFVYDPAANAIYMHGAKTGRTPATIAVNDRVCFSASEMGRLIAADEAVEVSVEFASVVVFGRVQMVTDPVEAEHGLKLLMEKYFPHLKPIENYRPIEAQDLKITAVLRIDIESWSGKEKRVADDFPGAFFYQDVMSKE